MSLLDIFESSTVYERSIRSTEHDTIDLERT